MVFNTCYIYIYVQIMLLGPWGVSYRPRRIVLTPTTVFLRVGVRNMEGAGYVECLHGHHVRQSINQPGKIAKPTRVQLTRKNAIFPVPVRA